MYLFKKNNNFGWKFPVQPDVSTGRIQAASYSENISESIRIILMTKKGERMMNPTFGCNINKYMFGILDFTTLRQIELEVEDALDKWEPRIENVKVEVVHNNDNVGQLIINVKYNLLNTRNIIDQQYIYNINN